MIEATEVDAEIKKISRSEIVAILRKWQNGALTATEVHIWAERIYFPGAIDFDDWEGEEDDRESIANYVLGALDMLDMNLMVAEDIPIYLEFLHTPVGQFAEGFRKYETALSKIDYSKRRQNLAHNPLYARFCAEIPNNRSNGRRSSNGD